MTKHTKDYHFLRSFALQHNKLPIHEFKQLLQIELNLVKDDYLYIKLLSCHCILNIFKQYDLPQEYHYDYDVHLFYITKQRAYDCFQNFYRLFYTSMNDDTFIRMPGFGKLIKGLYEGRVVTKRVGGRSRSNYCFSNLWIKDHIWEILKKKGVDIKGDSLLLRGQQRKIWQIYDLFTTNKQIPMETFFHNDLERDLYNSMVRCDEFFDHFVRTVSLNAVAVNDVTNRALTMLIDDWREVNVLEILKQNLRIHNEGSKYHMFQLSQSIASFPLLFETILNENMESSRSTTPDEQIQNLKKQMTNLLTSIYRLSKKLVTKEPKTTIVSSSLLSSSSNISADSKIYLNFQFIVTEILRSLTMSQKASFSSYWILSCFINEFLKLSIELEKL